MIMNKSLETVFKNKEADKENAKLAKGLLLSVMKKFMV